MINPKIVEWFDSRGIGPDTLTRMGIYSGRRVSLGDVSEVVEDAAGNVICFPTIEDGAEVAVKYRTVDKRFSQRPGGRKTFYNSAVLDEWPSGALDRCPLVIVEGEMDCLSVIEAGYPFVVSVPDGAPPGRDGSGNLIVVPEGTADIDPATDDKFRFVVNNWDALLKVKRIIIATDADDPGRRLAAELVRRLGRVRCSFVTFPDGCKDLNEVLIRLGPAAVQDAIDAAKPYPISGVYKLSEFPDEPPIEAVSTGWARLDPLLRIYRPSLVVVTGFAGFGKTSWTNQLVANLAYLHGWSVGIASFEMRIRPFVTDVLSAAYRDQHGSLRDVDRFLEDRFAFIAPEPDSEAVHDIGWLISRLEAAVIRHGVKVVVIDPWNEIEHERRKDETQTEYVGRAIKLLKRFARQFEVCVIIVAHPTKGAVDKGSDKIGLYDISDSSHFANKADQGIVIARKGDLKTDTVSSFIVKKVRYQPETGLPGEIDVNFDRANRIFGQ